MADVCHLENRLLAITQQPIAHDFSEILRDETVSQNFGNGTVTRVPRNIFLVFLMQFVWAPVSGGGFRIVPVVYKSV